MLKLIFTFILASVTLPSFANCDQLVTGIDKPVGYTSSQADRVINFADFRASHTNARQVIGAVARYIPESHFGPDAQHGEGLYDLDILVVSEDCRKIYHRLVQKEALVSDAESLNSIAVDTGRYNIAPEIRAFGVRATNGHQGGVSSERITLRLYAVIDGTLKQIMDPLVTRFAVSDPGDCSEFRETTRIIAISKNVRHGYVNLIVNETSEVVEAISSSMGCEQKSQKRKQHYIIPFDGKRYRLPPDLQQ